MAGTAEKDSKEPGINGGILFRRGLAPNQGQPVNAYVCTIGVGSVDEYVEKVVKAGGIVALEVKGSAEVQGHHMRGLPAFREEYKPRRAIVVSLDAKPRNVGGVSILPWKNFLNDLWAGSIIS